MIAKFHVHGVGDRECGEGLRGDTISVAKKSGVRGVILVAFVEGREHGEQAFHRFIRRIVKGEGDEFLGVDMRDIDVRSIPKGRVLRGLLGLLGRCL